MSPFEGVDRRVVAVSAGSFLFLGARMALLTFLAIHLGGEGIALPVVGAAFLVENVVRAAAAPLAGAWSDRVGRKPVMLASALAAMVVAPAVLIVRDAPGLFAWSVAAGLAQGAYFPSATALLLDIAPEARRQRVLAFHYSVLSVGYTVGVAPAGWLATHSFAWVAAECAAGYALVVLVVLLAVRSAPRAERNPAPRAAVLRAPRDPRFLALALPGFCFPLGIGLVSLALPVAAAQQGIGTDVIGYLLGATSLVLALLALPVAARIEAHGPRRFLPFAALCVALAHASFALGGAGFALGLLVFTAGELVFSSAVPVAVEQLAPRGLRGAYQGAWNMVQALGVGSALLLAGLGSGVLGWPGLWLAACAATLAAGAVLLARLRAPAPAEARLATAKP